MSLDYGLGTMTATTDISFLKCALVWWIFHYKCPISLENPKHMVDNYMEYGV